MWLGCLKRKVNSAASASRFVRFLSVRVSCSTQKLNNGLRQNSFGIFLSGSAI